MSGDDIVTEEKRGIHTDEYEKRVVPCKTPKVLGWLSGFISFCGGLLYDYFI